MRIGIVVPTLNRVAKTKRFIEQLKKQSYKDFKLYIVDSGSKDGTREYVESVTSISIELIDATLDDWWSHCTNMGAEKALNDGVELVLTINDDAIVMADYLEKFVGIFDSTGVKFLANRIDFADEPGKVWAIGSYSLWQTPWLFQLWQHGVWEDQLPKNILDSDIVPSQATCGDGVLIHKSVFESIGFFDENSTPQYHADSEFALRASRNGINVYTSPKVVLYNDVYNEPADSAVQKKKRSVVSEVLWLLFNKKSEIYFRSIAKIVLAEQGKLAAIKTLIKYYAWRFAGFYIVPKYIEAVKGSVHGRGFRSKSIFKKMLIPFLKRGAAWVLDYNTDDVVFNNDLNAVRYREKVNQQLMRIA